jgi:ketosteroid isomerase-like protein
MPRTAFAGALLLFALVGCAPKEAPVATAPAVDTAAVMAGLADAWSRWAVADTAGDLDALMDVFAEDGRVDAMGFPPMLGREAARATFAPLYAQVDYLEASATPEMTVVISNELAHQTGTVLERYTMKGRKGEMTDHARYAAAFVKGADGLWRWAYMMYMIDSTVTKK